MIEIAALGMGLMMTAVAVAVGGLTLDATFLILGRALRAPPLAASFEPAAIQLGIRSETLNLSVESLIILPIVGGLVGVIGQKLAGY